MVTYETAGFLVTFSIRKVLDKYRNYKMFFSYIKIACRRIVMANVMFQLDNWDLALLRFSCIIISWFSFLYRARNLRIGYHRSQGRHFIFLSSSESLSSWESVDFCPICSKYLLVWFDWFALSAQHIGTDFNINQTILDKNNWRKYPVSTSIQIPITSEVQNHTLPELSHLSCSDMSKKSQDTQLIIYHVLIGSNNWLQ